MSEFMNRRGVNLVSTECLKLEWLFREQHESDQGVDAIIEKHRHGFAASPKEHKAAPERYHGSVREVAQIVRVALTGSTRSPDLHQVALALGQHEVIRRVSTLTK
jgi:hypothetical protein